MRRFTKLVPKSGTTAPVTNIPRLVLAFEARKKSRQLVKLDSGEEIGILLPPGTILREGDVVESEDGSQFEIQAATENLMMVTAPDPFLLLRAAYHLGNRHTAIEIRPDRLFLAGRSGTERNASWPRGHGQSGNRKIHAGNRCIRRRS